MIKGLFFVDARNERDRSTGWIIYAPYGHYQLVIVRCWRQRLIFSKNYSFKNQLLRIGKNYPWGLLNDFMMQW